MKFYLNEFSNTLPRSPLHYFRASSSQLYSQPLFQSMLMSIICTWQKARKATGVPWVAKFWKNISDGLNLALFYRRKYQSDGCVGYDCGYTDQHQEWTSGPQSTKSTDKGTVILLLNHAGDKTSVCCMDLQAVVLTPKISRKQNCVFITLRSTTSPQRMFRLPMGWRRKSVDLKWICI